MAKGDTEMRAEDEGAGSEPRVYELGFHLDPELPTEAVKETYQAVRDLIVENGSIIAEGEPQMTQLAYTISLTGSAGRRDFDSAYFSWIVYEASANSHAEIISATAANARIIRFIDILTTKDAARHAVEMRDLAEKAPEKTEDAEATAGAELDAALDNVVI